MKSKSVAIFALTIFMLTFTLSCGKREKEMSLKIYDLVNLMPAGDSVVSDSIVSEVISFRKKGLEIICSQVVSPGKGNDSRYRLMVESVSEYLSEGGKEKSRVRWEKILVGNYEESVNIDLKNFFLEQLNVIGSDYYSIVTEKYLNNDMADSDSGMVVFKVD